MSRWVTLGVSFATDFLITAGSTVSGAMVAQGSAVMPGTAVWVLAIVVGIVAASRRVQALLQAPPQ